MPGGDGTGPFGDPNWPCRRIYGYGAGFRGGFGRGFGREYRRGFGRRFAWGYTEPATLTKEEQIKILEAELKDINSEKQEIEKTLEDLRKK